MTRRRLTANSDDIQVRKDMETNWLRRTPAVNWPRKDILFPRAALELLLTSCVHNVHNGIKLLGNVRGNLIHVTWKMFHWTVATTELRKPKDANTYCAIESITVSHQGCRKPWRIGVLQVILNNIKFSYLSVYDTRNTRKDKQWGSFLVSKYVRIVWWVLQWSEINGFSSIWRLPRLRWTVLSFWLDLQVSIGSAESIFSGCICS